MAGLNHILYASIDAHVSVRRSEQSSGDGGSGDGGTNESGGSVSWSGVVGVWCWGSV